mgnify:FL=1
MAIEIENLYGYDQDYGYLNKVIDLALKMENVVDAVFSIIFVDEKKIQDINREYRGFDRITDVISFAFEDALDVSYDFRFLGDIYICIPRMKEQALEYGHSEKRELSFLVVHGLLHLLGYDHQTEEEEKEMFSKQEVILNAADIKREA